MIDDTCKSFAVDENASVEQLRGLVIEKIELGEEGCFALFEKRDDWGIILHPNIIFFEFISEEFINFT